MSRMEDGGAVEAGLVERLEAWASVIEANDDCPAAGHTMHEAAAEITRLRAENAHWKRQAEAAQNNATLFQQDCARHVAEKVELRATLAPFAALAKRMLDKEIPRHIQEDEGTQVLGSGVAYEDPDAVVVTVGDLRRAALSKASQAEGQTP